MIRKKSGARKERKKYDWYLKKLKSDLRLKVRKLKKGEREEAYRYIIVSILRERVIDLEHIYEDRKKKSSKDHSGIDYIGHKISVLPAKIKLFEVDFEKQEFKKICALIRDVVEELKDV